MDPPEPSRRARCCATRQWHALLGAMNRKDVWRRYSGWVAGIGGIVLLDCITWLARDWVVAAEVTNEISDGKG